MLPLETDGSQINDGGESCQHLDEFLYLTHGASADLLGQDVLGELQGEVDQEQEKLRHREAGQEHARVDVVASTMQCQV